MNLSQTIVDHLSSSFKMRQWLKTGLKMEKATRQKVAIGSTKICVQESKFSGKRREKEEDGEEDQELTYPNMLHLHFILRCSLVARLSLFDKNTLSAYLPCYCV